MAIAAALTAGQPGGIDSGGFSRWERLVTGGFRRPHAGGNNAPFECGEFAASSIGRLKGRAAVI